MTDRLRRAPRFGSNHGETATMMVRSIQLQTKKTTTALTTNLLAL